MNEQVISCPKCATKIPLSEALAQQLDARVAEDSRRREEELTRKFALERERLEKEAVRKADERRAVEMRDLQIQIQEKAKQLEESREKELQLRKRERELEDARKNADLELQRRLDAERKVVAEQARMAADQEHRQKQLEAEKKLQDMTRAMDEMKRKLEQGSQQTQGEVVELELENVLKTAFPFDVIEPVAKGVRGADVIQRVVNKNGQTCGTIIWESKQTKAWSDGWIPKLKDDQRAVKADVAVLLTAALPKGIVNFGSQGGVWVTNQACASSLALALRGALEQVAFARSTAVGRKEKSEALYTYLMGNEFLQHVRAVVDTTATLKTELDREKRAFARIWAEREKQIQRIEAGMTGMYGDLKGLGAAVPQIDALELAPTASEAIPAAGKRVALPGPDREAEEDEELF